MIATGNADTAVRTPRARFIAQSGVIAYRSLRGRIEIALVTASSGPHWTIPKGHVEPDMTPHDSAAKEAYEECGLIGRVESRSIGRYSYEKRGSTRQVDVYALEVTRTLTVWPEMHLRQRRWMTVEEAASRVKSAELRCCIQSFKRMMRKEARSAAA